MADRARGSSSGFELRGDELDENPGPRSFCRRGSRGFIDSDIERTSKSMKTTQSSTTTEKRRDRPRWAPPSGVPPSPDDAEISGAKAYLDLFGPPALANTADTYFQTYAVLRTVLEGAPKHHAHTVMNAAQDVAESHVERRMDGGGQNR
jgi:hypothetical protein